MLESNNLGQWAEGRKRPKTDFLKGDEAYIRPLKGQFLMTWRDVLAQRGHVELKFKRIFEWIEQNIQPGDLDWPDFGWSRATHLKLLESPYAARIRSLIWDWRYKYDKTFRLRLASTENKKVARTTERMWHDSKLDAKDLCRRLIELGPSARDSLTRAKGCLALLRDRTGRLADRWRAVETIAELRTKHFPPPAKSERPKDPTRQEVLAGMRIVDLIRGALGQDVPVARVSVAEEADEKAAVED